MALSGWDALKKTRLVLDNNTIDAALSDFPVLVNLDSAAGKTSYDMTPVFDEVGWRSTKIAVENGDTGNQCYVEVERWNDFVLLLIESDTTDDSTTFTDSSKYNHTVTCGGGVVHKTTYPYDGATSMYFPGTTDYFTLAASSDWNMGTDPVTYELYVRFNTVAAQQTLINQWLHTTSATDEFYLYLTSGGKIGLFPEGYQSGAGTSLVGTTTIAVDTWYHVALTFDGTTVKVWLDGVQELSWTGTLGTNSDHPLVIGTNAASVTTQELIGYIASLRITKGKCLYTTTFTPPTTISKSVIDDAQIWVKVPTASSSADTTLYLYYDSDHADNTTYVGDIGSTPGQTVWDSNNKFLTHMAQDPSGSAPQILDSTSTGKDGTSYGTMTTADMVDGPIGKALDFDGTDDYINFGYDAAHNITTTLTIEATIKPSSTLDSALTNDVGIVSRRHDATDSESTWALVINADGKLELQTAAGTAVGTKASWTSGTTYYVAATYDSTGPTVELWVDGVKETLTVNSPASMTGSTTNNLVAGKNADASEFFPGVIDEVRVSAIVRSDAWIKATYYSNDDNSITFSSITTYTAIGSFLDQQYGISTEVMEHIDQVYGIKLGSYIDQLYSLALNIQNHLDQIYGIRLLGMLAQPYGNAPLVRAILNQYYDDAALVQSYLDQRYGNALNVKSTLEQPYHLPQLLRSVLEQRYAIAGTEVQSFLNQVYDLHQYNLIKSTLNQPWIIAAYESLKAAINATVTIGGRTVDPFHINVEADRGRYFWEGELHFKDPADYVQIDEEAHEPVVITINTREYHLVVISKIRSRERSGTVYIVRCASKAILMRAPYAAPILQEFSSGQASDICQALATPFGITLDWQIVDWTISANKLYANNETPIQVIRKVVRAAGGRMQCLPDGTLKVIPRYPVTLPDWESANPATTLTDNDNFYKAVENKAERSGHNKFLISNQLTATSSERLEEETINATTKRIRAYVVPWSESSGLTLLSSKTGVVPEPLDVDFAGPAVEIEEIIEFVNGVGSVSDPVYEILEQEYLDTQLGAITFSEDGTLEADVKGESLVRIKYRTRYLLWQAVDDRIEDVQFVLDDGV